MCSCVLLCSAKPLVKFFVNSSKALKGLGTGTLCYPDLTARHSSTSVTATAIAVWLDLEAVVAFHSSGETIRENTEQAVAYTAYLLTARPDRVAMLGLHISQQDYTVILADPTGIYYSHRLLWENISLLRRALYYIEDPPLCMTDPTIEREAMGRKMASKIYHGCQQQWSPTLGRWTVIFATSPRLVNRMDGSPMECGPMNNRRRMDRLELKDKGEPFMMIDTPYDALVAIWDLLEGDAFISISDLPLTYRVSESLPLQRGRSPPSGYQ